MAHQFSKKKAAFQTTSSFLIIPDYYLVHLTTALK